jgi:hypothetical protein
MQVRPGIAVSAVLHVALFFYLAYALAFHPAEKPKEEEHAIDMVAPPPPPPCYSPAKRSLQKRNLYTLLKTLKNHAYTTKTTTAHKH